MSSHEIQELVRQEGCLLVFVVVALQALGLPFPGTTALIAAAVYAATAHGLPIAGVIAAGALGAMAGTSAGFVLGRLGGERALLRVARRWPGGPHRVHRLRREFAEHGAPWLFVSRFITGLRNVAGLLAGASGMALSRFLLVSAAASTAWALIIALGYYWFGRTLAAASTWVQIVLGAAGIAWTVLSVSWLRRRALRRLDGEPAQG